MPILVFAFWIIVLVIISSVTKNLKKNANRQTSRQKTQQQPQPSPNAWHGKLSSKIYEAWMMTAGALHMEYIRPTENNIYPAIQGKSGDYTLKVNCYSPAPGMPPEVFAKVTFPSPSHLGLRIVKDMPNILEIEKSKRKLFAMFEPCRFPDDLLFAADDIEELKKYLTVNCVDDIKLTCNRFPNFRISDNSLKIHFPSIFRDEETMVNELKQVLNTAQLFYAHAQLIERKILRPLSTQTIDPLPHLDDQEVIEDIREFRNVQKSKAQQPTSKDFVLSQPEKQTETVITEPEIKIETPDQPEADAVQENTPPQAVTPTVAPDKETLLKELFPGTFAASENSKKLFETLKGYPIEWDGVLRTTYDYFSDFTFGNGPGIKATVEILEFSPPGSIMKVKVKAVVAFTKENAEYLKKQTGKTIRFRGTLLKMESFAKEIYLADGQLIGE